MKSYNLGLYEKSMPESFSMEEKLTLAKSAGFDFMEILIKMLGISYICELSAGICKDAGYHSIAMQIVIFGKITIMTLGSSILFSLIKIINTYLG